jgi:two-component system, chemotaxis family, sensor kinase CheA
MAENDLLNIFRDEVSEYLESLNEKLLQIEMIAEDDAAYHPMMIEMNRVSHSMKGAARAVGMTMIETISHYMEEVFAAAMRYQLKLTPDICDTLYDGIDLIQNVMDGEENNEQTLAEVLIRLEQAVSQGENHNPQTDSQQVAVIPAVATEETEIVPSEIQNAPTLEVAKHAKSTTMISVQERPTLAAQQVEAQTLALRPVEETVRVTVSKLDRLMAEATELLVARMHGELRQRSINDLRKVHAKWQREWRSVRTGYIRLMRRVQDGQEKVSPELAMLLKFMETNQRYLTEVNRRLTQLAQSVAQDNMHLATLTDQLQDDIGGMRLIPFDFIVSGFQRSVRDLARDMGKQIQLDISGAFVEIDKTVLDALKDPLTHLIRNAVDHGIETPAERESRGKAPTGHIQIDVEQRGSEIVMTVRDDGRGIDLERVRRSIVRQKLLTETEAQSLGDDEVRFYIFHPGLSTSDKVTAVSGRGMGMDIVRERVESLRGRVSIHSEIGKGTTVTINVPVSLTRIRCILLRVGEQEFAIPSVVVARMQTVDRYDFFTAEGQEMLIVNGQPVPVVSLGATLNIPVTGHLNDIAHLLILQTANRTVAFEVDELLSERELVLKPLGPELVRAPYVSGAALLGSGEVLIVLDANDLVRAATGSSMPRRRTAVLNAPPQTQQRLRILVVDDSITTRTLEKNILETAGFEVYTAIDGVEAWGLLDEHDFDVVISDVEMPKMNGLELTTRIKQTSHYRNLPVILLTSLSKPEQREAGLRAGADAYLVKTQFDQSELLQTIQSVI